MNAELKEGIRDLARAATEDGTHPEVEEDGEETPTFRLLAELMERPELLEPPECVVPYLGYRGRATALCAPDKAGKSTLVAHAIARLTLGHHFLGQPVNAVHYRVVELGLEEALGDKVRRYAELGAVPDRVQVVTMAGPDLLERTDDLLTDWPADLVVVDSLSEFARVTLGSAPEDGDSSGWGQVVRPLVALARRHDLALIILHHVRRADGQYRGSSEIAAAVDALLEMAMPEKGEDPTSRRITGRGRWPIEPVTVALRDGRYELFSGAGLSRDALIILHVEQNPGCSLRDVLDAVPGRTTAVSTTVRELVARGAIEDRSETDRMSLYPGTSAEAAA